jgi:formylglycine-generating enzyme required for sulfatase activity
MPSVTKRSILQAIWVIQLMLLVAMVGAQDAADAKGPAIKLNCRIGGKLYIDKEFIGVVLGGYQYPVFDVEAGERKVRIIGVNQTWETTVTVTNVKPMLVTTPTPKPPPVVVVKPDPPVVKPDPPVVKPDPPVVKPDPPVQKRKLWVVDAISLRLASIPAGSFKMGDAKGRPYEQPVHKVTLTSPFWMATTHVTSTQYKALVPKFRMRGRPNDTPMVNVTWWDAVSFCEALTEREKIRLPKGYEFRLPTEAEWEYACRAGTTTRYFFGDDGAAIKDYGVTARSPQKVGTLKPNPWGIYDLYGNVQEYCLDACPPRLRNAPKTYFAGATDPLEVKGEARVLRSGHYKSRASGQYNAYRSAYSPIRPYKATGFRVVLAKKMPLPSEGRKPRGR